MPDAVDIGAIKALIQARIDHLEGVYRTTAAELATAAAELADLRRLLYQPKSPKSAEPSGRSLAVLEFLRGRVSPARAEEVALGVGISDRTATMVLWRMARRGLIKRVARGLFQASPTVAP